MEYIEHRLITEARAQRNSLLEYENRLLKEIDALPTSEDMRSTATLRREAELIHVMIEEISKHIPSMESILPHSILLTREEARRLPANFWTPKGA